MPRSAKYAAMAEKCERFDQLIRAPRPTPRGARWLPRAWPGLSNSYEPDLTVTTDYRQVLADVVSRRFGASVAQVFPGLHWESTGVMV